jgi:uncharacterized repeat protein (TIGR03803 family)
MIKSLCLSCLLLCVQIAAAGQSLWTETILHTFTLNDGSNPQGLVVVNNVIYGETQAGGRNGLGTLFSLSPPAQPGGTWNLTDLYDFSGPTDGSGPNGGLLAAPNGTFFGVTGGYSPNEGTVFSFKTVPTPTLTAIYTFSGADGAVPIGPLIADANGNLYGVTQSGGSSSQGVVYELSPPSQRGAAWSFTSLYSFTGGSDGGLPAAGLIMDAHGTLYGTTSYGGIAVNVASGVIFRLVPPLQSGGLWSFSVLHAFLPKTDGATPYARLTLDHAGNLYGTTESSGPGGSGTAFRLTPTAMGTGPWIETVLQSFSGGDNGATPMGPLSWGPNDLLYGSAAFNGRNFPACGTIFSLTPPAGTGEWQESVLHVFGTTIPPDGCAPRSSLLISPTGALLGTTYDGGPGNGYGTVWALTPPK